MEMLKDWVRDLVILVIFVSIIEMLLPGSSLKKYVKVVMGFFIMLAVLNPLLSLLHADYRTFYPFNDLPGQRREQVVVQQEGEQLKKHNEALAVAAFQDQISRQMQALILTQSEINTAEVQVKANESGQVEKVFINLELATDVAEVTKTVSQVIPIEKVTINIAQQTESIQADKNGPVDARLAKVQAKIGKLLVSFYNIKEEAIIFQ